MKPQTIVDLSAENLVAIVAERTYNAISHAWTLGSLSSFGSLSSLGSLGPNKMDLLQV